MDEEENLAARVPRNDDATTLIKDKKFSTKLVSTTDVRNRANGAEVPKVEPLLQNG